MLSGLALDNEINELLKTRQFATALETIKSQLKKNEKNSYPVFIKLHYLYLFCLFKLNRFSEIIEQYNFLKNIERDKALLLTDDERNQLEYMGAFGFAECGQPDIAHFVLARVSGPKSPLYSKAQIMRALLYIKSEDYSSALACLALIEDTSFERSEYFLLKGIAFAKLHQDYNLLSSFVVVFNQENATQKHIANLPLKLKGILLLIDKLMQEQDYSKVSQLCRLMRNYIPRLPSPEELYRFDLDVQFYEALIALSIGSNFQPMAEYETLYFQCTGELASLKTELAPQYAQLLLCKAYILLRKDPKSAQNTLLDPFWIAQESHLPHAIRMEHELAKLVYATKIGNPWLFKELTTKIYVDHIGKDPVDTEVLFEKAKLWLPLLTKAELAASPTLTQISSMLFPSSKETELAQKPNTLTPAYSMSMASAACEDAEDSTIRKIQREYPRC